MRLPGNEALKPFHRPRLWLGLWWLAIVFGIALRTHGWRVTYLGADTPPETLAVAVAEIAPAAVVVVALARRRLEGDADVLAEVGRKAPLWIAGDADAALAERLGAQLLDGGPVEAATTVAASA